MSIPDTTKTNGMATDEMEPAKLPIEDVLSRVGAGSYALQDGDDGELSDFGNDFDPAKAVESPAAEVTPPNEPAQNAPPASETPPTDPDKGSETPPSGEQTPEPPSEPQKKRSTVVSRDRFDELNEKYKATQARLAELEAQSNKTPASGTPPAPETPSVDLDAMEAEYMEAVLDGDKDKALKIRKEIRTAEQKMLTPKVEEQKPAPTATEIRTQIAYEDTVAELNERFPAFDPDSDDFDEDATTEAVALTRAYRAQGLSPEKALRKAVEKVVKANGIKEAGAAEAPATPLNPPATPLNPPATPPKAPPPPDPSKLKEKLEAVGGQPPKPAGTAGREQPMDIDQMSETEWDALPEATKARLRGDYV